MNKTWIIVIGVAVIGIIAFFILRKGDDSKTTTTTSTQTSSETNGLLDSIVGAINPIKGLFSSGDK